MKSAPKKGDALKNAQPGILAPIPRHARHLTFGLKQGVRPEAALRALAATADGESCVVGLGAVLLFALQKRIEGLRPFPHHKGQGVDVPSTPAAAWCWVRGKDRGEIVLRARAIEKILAPAGALSEVVVFVNFSILPSKTLILPS